MDVNKNLWEIIDHLRDELNITIDSLTSSSESCEDLYKTNLKMNKEIEELKHKPLNEIDALNKSLETYKRRLYKARDQRDELKAENDRAREYIAQVEKENDTLKYANTMFHAKEWFNNNPKCDKVYVFVLDADGVNDDGWIADSHAVVSINDGNCVGSYVRNTNE